MALVKMYDFLSCLLLNFMRNKQIFFYAKSKKRLKI